MQKLSEDWKIFMFKCPLSMGEWLDAYAKENKTPGRKSGVVRQAIEEFIARHENGENGEDEKDD